MAAGRTHGEAASAPNTQLHLNAPFKGGVSVELRMTLILVPATRWKKNKMKIKCFLKRFCSPDLGF